MASTRGRDIESSSVRWHDRQPRLTISQTRFMRACTGGPATATTEDELSYLKLVQHRTKTWETVYENVLHANFQSTSPFEDRMLLAIAAILEIYRLRKGISINRALKQLVEDKVIRDSTKNGHTDTLEQWVLAAIGAATLLLHPSDTHEIGHFDIETSGAKSFSQRSISKSLASRPLYELLRGFGEVLPKSPGINSQFKSQSDDQVDRLSARPKSFQVSYLNAATLHYLAGIKIVWVDCIGSHLSFDPAVPALSLFKVPSFCNLHKATSPNLEIVTHEFYSEGERPTTNFTISQYMGEIILSYALLIRDDRSSRELYRKQREKAGLDDTSTLVDPLLDKLCGRDLSNSVWNFRQPVRESYNAAAHFPILRGRLEVIEDYMAGIQPSRVTSLWRDRRDIRTWYTIWAVLIVGGMSIFLACISVYLAAAQLALAAKAYQLQLQQK